MITLDIIMPDLDGWSVLKALKDDPELCEIPVVLATIMGDRDMGFALGAADLVTKPFDREVPAWWSTGIVGATGRRRSWSTTTRDRGTCWGGRCRRKAGPWPRPSMAAKLLGQLERSRPALVLLDLMMPEMDGFDVLERMRRQRLARRPGDHRDRQGSHARGGGTGLNGRVVKVLQKGTYRRRDLLDDVRALLARRECQRGAGICRAGWRLIARGN